MDGNRNLSLVVMHCCLLGLGAGAQRFALGTCAHVCACEQLMGGQRKPIAVERLHGVAQHVHGLPRCMAGIMLTKATLSGTM